MSAMFYLVTFIDFCEYVLIQKLKVVTCVKQVGTGATKDCESCGTLQKHLKIMFYTLCQCF